MKILVFEDEIHHYHILRTMLEKIDPTGYVVGPISSVKQGLDVMHYLHHVDLIIADIQLNDGLSFDALKYAPDDVPIIFTSSSSEHAFRAFDFLSLSYLLKPVDEDRLRIAIEKAKRLIHPCEQKNADTTVPDVVYRERFVVKTAKGDKVILFHNVWYIVSEQKTTYIRLLDGTSFPIDMPLDTIAHQLDPRKFKHVNRKYIVPIEQVSGTERLGNGRLRLCLSGENPPEIFISRTRRNEIVAWLGK